MILAQPELREAVKRGEIVFDPPLEDKQWGEASVDLRLGFRFTKLKKVEGVKFSVAEGLATLASTGLWVTKDLRDEDEFGKPETFTLNPDEFILAMTYENIKVPNNMIALVEGRSTYARVGLSMHQTAPWIQPGFDGPIILEIMNNGPLYLELIPIVDRPCQLTFFMLTSELPPEMIKGAYRHQKHPIDHQKENKH